MRRSTAAVVTCLVILACAGGDSTSPGFRGRMFPAGGAHAQEDPSRILNRSSVPGLAFQFMPCLDDQPREEVVGKLKTAFKDPGTGASPDVRTTCVGRTHALSGTEAIGIWLNRTPRGGPYDRGAGRAMSENAQQRGLATVSLLEGDETFAWSASDSFIEQVRTRVWEVQPRRLSRDGEPNPEGTIQLQGLSFSLIRPDRVRTEIRGFIETGVDVDFTTRVRDTIVIKRGKLRLSQTSEVDAATGWFEAAAIFLSVLLPPVGMPLYEDIAARDGKQAPDEITSRSLGTMLVQSAPDSIALVGSEPSRRDPQELVAQKVDFVHRRFAIDSSGVTGGGVHTVRRREPRVSIVGPREPVAIDDRSKTLRYSIATTDMRSDEDNPLRVSWSADGQVASATSSSTRITFTVPANVAPGREVTRRVSVDVTDADGLVASRSLDVRINYQRGDRPPICYERPWLPQCPGGQRRRR